MIARTANGWIRPVRLPPATCRQAVVLASQASRAAQQGRRCLPVPPSGPHAR